MATFTALADAEVMTRTWLASQFPSPIRVVTELPADLGNVPTIHVVRIGGTSQQITMDAANVDVDYFDGPHDGLSARENARAGINEVRVALLYHFGGQVVAGGAVQSVSEISGPRWVPYDNTNVRRFIATYRITIHSIPA